MSTLEICEAIAACDTERARLESLLIAETGKNFEQFIGDMRQLFETGMTISVCGGPEMTPAEFLDQSEAV